MAGHWADGIDPPSRAQVENDALRARIAELEAERAELVKEAHDEIWEWAAYASPYFQHKHDLAGTLEKWKSRQAIDAAREVE